MQFAKRGDLGGKIKRAKDRREHLPEKDIWVYFSQICEALEYMHSRDILHRDLKPMKWVLFVGIDFCHSIRVRSIPDCIPLPIAVFFATQQSTSALLIWAVQNWWRLDFHIPRCVGNGSQPPTLFYQIYRAKHGFIFIWCNPAMNIIGGHTLLHGSWNLAAPAVQWEVRCLVPWDHAVRTMCAVTTIFCEWHEWIGIQGTATLSFFFYSWLGESNAKIAACNFVLGQVQWASFDIKVSLQQRHGGEALII